ncbi:hypothetical protein NUU61_004615 [Penicillium alfredii]|uniref:Uncharacterized protein n=1 Tax=Penicillium alfredii TaxID=1506179 RepID=A0A9W9FLK3_9EURO|nr:uncharacterized protein NUU61_004615 [Penicillium alfredii]KAJ5102393.1 hypothetical protein NUU61_004615 [Penicillium alfredii]
MTNPDVDNLDWLQAYLPNRTSNAAPSYNAMESRGPQPHPAFNDATQIAHGALMRSQQSHYPYNTPSYPSAETNRGLTSSQFGHNSQGQHDGPQYRDSQRQQYVRPADINPPTFYQPDVSGRSSASSSPSISTRPSQQTPQPQTQRSYHPATQQVASRSSYQNQAPVSQPESRQAQTPQQSTTCRQPISLSTYPSQYQNQSPAASSESRQAQNHHQLAGNRQETSRSPYQSPYQNQSPAPSETPRRSSTSPAGHSNRGSPFIAPGNTRPVTSGQKSHTPVTNPVPLKSPQQNPASASTQPAPKLATSTSVSDQPSSFMSSETFNPMVSPRGFNTSASRSTLEPRSLVGKGSATPASAPLASKVSQASPQGSSATTKPAIVAAATPPTSTQELNTTMPSTAPASTSVTVHCHQAPSGITPVSATTTSPYFPGKPHSRPVSTGKRGRPRIYPSPEPRAKPPGPSKATTSSISTAASQPPTVSSSPASNSEQLRKLPPPEGSNLAGSRLPAAPTPPRTMNARPQHVLHSSQAMPPIGTSGAASVIQKTGTPSSQPGSIQPNTHPKLPPTFPVTQPSSKPSHGQPPNKVRRILSPGGPTTPLSEPPSKIDLSRYPNPASSSHVKLRTDLCQILDKNDAARKEEYDATTIARDVLINANRHPTEKHLNHHLEKVRNSFSLDLRVDLATFRWDLVDAPRDRVHVPAKPVGSHDHGMRPEAAQYYSPLAALPFKPHSYHSRPISPSPLPPVRSTPVPSSKPPQPPTQPPAQPPKSHPPPPSPKTTPTRKRPLPTEARPTSAQVSQSPRTHELSQPQVVIPPSPNPMPPKKKPGRPPGRPAGRTPGRPKKVEVAITKQPPKPAKEVPKYQVFSCLWGGCAAELHNLAALQGHILKVHVPHNMYCEWKECERPGPMTASNLWEHVHKTHMEPVAWELGDGPVVPGIADKKLQGPPFSPSFSPLTSHISRKPAMILPADPSMINAFSRVHGTTVMVHKAKAFVNGGSHWKQQTGPEVDQSDRKLSTPSRQYKADDKDVACLTVY